MRMRTARRRAIRHEATAVQVRQVELVLEQLRRRIPKWTVWMPLLDERVRWAHRIEFGRAKFRDLVYPGLGHRRARFLDANSATRIARGVMRMNWPHGGLGPLEAPGLPKTETVTGTFRGRFTEDGLRMFGNEAVLHPRAMDLVVEQMAAAARAMAHLQQERIAWAELRDRQNLKAGAARWTMSDLEAYAIMRSGQAVHVAPMIDLQTDAPNG